ncbi:brahma associated protein 170kD isoform X2 [Rhodnius prolixus]|uniref:brahma associated protein 170kD isoform X2 n=1 Tax=Rhodnius prolixus TaxID=13249 RepID=UPI003D18A186
MAQILEKTPLLYGKEKESFLRDLLHFHETRGTPSRRSPKINGHEIDLYLLYNLVTGRGGWVKVNSRNEWDQILAEFNIPKHCVNGGVAIKQIYLRYLDRYEKLHFLGEIGERGGDDDEDSRHRRWSARALHSVPLSYNHAQHTFNESLRDYNGLAVELYRESEYDKLALSLISPLPNEQDFAINVCTVLSNEGKHCLKLEKHPRILHYLLAHAAVFRETSLKELFFELYGKDRRQAMHSFWRDVILDQETLKLTNETVISSDRTTEGLGKKYELNTELSDTNLFCLGRSLGTNEYVGQRVTQIATILRNLSFTPENAPFMARDITFIRFAMLCCSSRWNGLSQMGWDMLSNIASDLPTNSPLLYDLLLLTTKGLLSDDRAVIMSSLDVLNKLAQADSNEHVLLSNLNQEVFDRVCSFLSLHDIMLLICTLECLNAISSLGEKACNSIVRVRGAVDVLVSLITVEAQSYGPRACIQMRVVETVIGNSGSTTISSSSSTNSSPIQNTPVTTSGLALQTTTSDRGVLSSATVMSSANVITSASILNSASVITTGSVLNSGTVITTGSVINSGTVLSSGNDLSSSGTPSFSTSIFTNSTSNFSNTVTTVASYTAQNVTSVPVSIVATIPVPNLSPVTTALHHQAPVTLQTPVTTAPVAVTTSPTCSQRASTSTSLNSALATQQVAQENEQFALAWLRSTFEPQNGGSMEQAELYKQYINYCASIGRRGVIAPLHFPRCVRSVFGGTVGPKAVTVGEVTQHHYEGISLRSKPLIPKSSIVVPGILQNLPTTPSPILKAQLSAPPKPSAQVSPLPTKVIPRQGPQARLLHPSGCPVPMNSVIRPLVEDKSLNHTSSTKLPIPNSKLNGLRPDVPNKLEETAAPNVIVKCAMNHQSRPPPLAPLSSANKLPPKGVTQSCQTLSVSTEETASSNTSSSGNRDNSGTTVFNFVIAGEEGANSAGSSSLDGFLLNGIPNSLDLGDTTSKDFTPKSLMLADLLEKNIERREPPSLNGALRLVERGLELVHSGAQTAAGQMNGAVTMSMKSQNNTLSNTTATSNQDLKRPNTCAVNDVPLAKKVHLNGDVKTKEPPEEGNVSSSAANLYAALAADALEDEPVEELAMTVSSVGGVTATQSGMTAGMVQGQVVMQSPTTAQHTRQILVTTGAGLTQRVVVGGQHYVVAQPQTTLVQHGAQTVLLAQTTQQQGTGAKTIIILQPQSVPTGSTPTSAGKVVMQRLGQTVTVNHNTAATTSAGNTTQSTTHQSLPHQIHFSHHLKKTVLAAPSSGTGIVGNSSMGNVAMPAIPAPCATPVSIITPPKVGAVHSAVPSTATTSATNSMSLPSHNFIKIPNESQGHFLCEWRGCMRNFRSGNEVYMHACEAHCPQGSQEIQCLWERCDAMKRKRFSLMTHLYDKHCNADVMKMMAVRRKQLKVTGRSEIPAPVPAAPHPGYAPNAAFHAIKRHALEFVNPKELQQRAAKPGTTPATVPIEQDDNEGPVTKSIRLTAALILRNLVIYSSSGKRYLTRYEPHLANVALSNVESSRTIAHVLFDMNQTS